MPEGVRKLRESKRTQRNLPLTKKLQNACNETLTHTEFSNGTCEIKDENGDTQAVIEATDSATSVKAYNEPDTNMSAEFVGEENHEIRFRPGSDHIEVQKKQDKGGIDHMKVGER